MIKNTLAALTVGCLLWPAPGSAHHSQAMYTDASGAISITGVVKKFEFTNPHSFIYLEVTGDDGKTKLWALEMQSVTHLKSIGWMVRPPAEVGGSHSGSRPASHPTKIVQLVLRIWQRGIDYMIE